MSVFENDSASKARLFFISGDVQLDNRVAFLEQQTLICKTPTLLGNPDTQKRVFGLLEVSRSAGDFEAIKAFLDTINPAITQLTWQKADCETSKEFVLDVKSRHYEARQALRTPSEIIAHSTRQLEVAAALVENKPELIIDRNFQKSVITWVEHNLQFKNYDQILKFSDSIDGPARQFNLKDYSDPISQAFFRCLKAAHYVAAKKTFSFHKQDLKDSNSLVLGYSQTIPEKLKALQIALKYRSDKMAVSVFCDDKRSSALAGRYQNLSNKWERLIAERERDPKGFFEKNMPFLSSFLGSND